MFSFESEMTYPVKRWLERRSFYVDEEVSTGSGVCDLVACAFNEKAIELRTAHSQRQPIGSAESVLVYLTLPDSHLTSRGMRIDTLRNRIGPASSDIDLSSILARLLKNNHIRETATNTYQRVNGWWPLQSNLISIELKLSRISDVLQQATLNLSFADESYAAFPGPLARRLIQSETYSCFSDLGIGILAVYSTRCQLLLESDPNKNTYLDDVLQCTTVENFWRRYRGKH